MSRGSCPEKRARQTFADRAVESGVGFKLQKNAVRWLLMEE